MFGHNFDCTGTVFIALSLLVLRRTALAKGLPRLSTQKEPSLLERHLATLAIDQEVILTQTSCGYLEFAINWIAYIDGLGIINWLTIAEDQAALTYLEKKHPGHVLPSSVLINEDLSEAKHYLEIGSAAFTKLACARPVYLEIVLGLGYKVVWSDMDTVWLENFLKLMPRDLDYVGIDDSEGADEQMTPHACTALMSFCPTARAKHLLASWRDRCLEMRRANQPSFNEVFSKLRSDLNYTIMSKALYPHGKLIDQMQYVHHADAPSSSGFRPAWIHANYRKGHHNKQKFLRDRLVWKVDASSAGLPICPKEPDITPPPTSHAVLEKPS